MKIFLKLFLVAFIALLIATEAQAAHVYITNNSPYDVILTNVKHRGIKVSKPDITLISPGSQNVHILDVAFQDRQYASINIGMTAELEYKKATDGTILGDCVLEFVSYTDGISRFFTSFFNTHCTGPIAVTYTHSGVSAFNYTLS